MRLLNFVLLASFALLTNLSVAANPYAIIVHAVGEEVARGSGVLVADTTVLVSIALIDQGDEYFVVDPATGALYSTEIRSYSDAFALLSVVGLTGDGVTLAAQSPALGAKVQLALTDSSHRDGLLVSITPSDSLESATYRLNIAVDDNELGTPVLNRCGAVIGLISGFAAQDSLGLSTTYEDLSGFLEEHGVSVPRESAACLSLESELEKTQREADSLEAAQAALDSLLQASVDSSEAARRQIQAQLNQVISQRSRLAGQLEGLNAQISEKDSVIQTIPGLEAEIDSIRVANEELRRELEVEIDRSRSRQRNLLIGGGGALITLIVLMLILLRGHRRRAREELGEAESRLQEVEDELAHKSYAHPDILLFGGSSAVTEIRTKVSGIALAQRLEGLVIGRSAASADCVVSEPSVSRSHACIRLVEQQLVVEDLDSLNGTYVDGTRIAEGQQMPLKEGAVLSLGDAKLKVKVLK